MRSVEYLKSQGVDVDQSLDIFGDISTYNSSIGEFTAGVTEKIKKMETYKASKDIKNYGIYAHSLKSDAKFFGFTKLSDLAAEMETKSNENDWFYIDENYKTLADEANKSLEVIKEYMNGTDDVAAPVETPAEPAQAEAAPTEAAPAEAAPAEAAPAEAPKPASNAVVYDKRTILVVDDSNIIRNFVKRIFSEEYEVGTAKDGQEAIDILEANKDNDFIETILLDLNMPRVDGFAVLDYMQENGLLSKFPVSIISGDSSKETIDKAFNYQIVDMLSKPFNEQSVKNVIEKTLIYKGMD